jgi:hypothetical protein
MGTSEGILDTCSEGITLINRVSAYFIERVVDQMRKRIFKNSLPGQGVGFFLILALISFGCAGASNYGKIKRSPEITQNFKNYEVLPDYTYFHNGWENNPYAIVGIRSDYNLVSKKNLWKQIDANTTSIQRLVDALFEDYHLYPYGFYMTAPDGSEIGILYSSISNVSIKMVDEKSVMIVMSPVYLRGGGRYDF